MSRWAERMTSSADRANSARVISTVPGEDGVILESGKRLEVIVIAICSPTDTSISISLASSLEYRPCLRVRLAIMLSPAWRALRFALLVECIDSSAASNAPDCITVITSDSAKPNYKKICERVILEDIHGVNFNAFR